jgi:hypothetical protein
LTIYEAGGGGPLPKNGEQWHAVREGMLLELQQCSQDFNELIKVRQEACVQQYIMGETVQVMNSFIRKKELQSVSFCGAPAHVSYWLKQRD